MRGRRRGDVGDDVGARLQLALQLRRARASLAVPVEGVAVRAHLLLLDAEAVARAGRVLLDDVRAEVEELLERQQVLVGLLAPLAEADQDEVLLEVALLFGERVQARVLDRHRGLQRERLRALHLFRREAARACRARPGSPRRSAARPRSAAAPSAIARRTSARKCGSTCALAAVSSIDDRLARCRARRRGTRSRERSPCWRRHRSSQV